MQDHGHWKQRIMKTNSGQMLAMLKEEQHYQVIIIITENPKQRIISRLIDLRC